MADGGEGTVDALVAATGGSVREAAGHRAARRTGARPVRPLGDGRTAVIEMAAASGLVLGARRKRNPLIATTRGTGELLLAAIAAGRETRDRGHRRQCHQRRRRRARSGTRFSIARCPGSRVETGRRRARPPGADRFLRPHA